VLSEIYSEHCLLTATSKSRRKIQIMLRMINNKIVGHVQCLFNTLQGFKLMILGQLGKFIFEISNLS
jgi:hypothetical protein